MAITLGQNGYDVVVHYNSSAEGAEEACRQIRDCGGRAWPVQADLSAMSGVRELFAQAMEKLGHLDLYVNNSGITRKSDFLETTEDFFDRMVDVDLKSAYFCVQAAAREMVCRDTKGSIVIITSNNGLQQRPNLSVYGTLKAGLIKLGRHAAMELAQISDPCQYDRSRLDGNAQNDGAGRNDHLQQHPAEALVQTGGDRTHDPVSGIAHGRLPSPETALWQTAARCFNPTLRKPTAYRKRRNIP